MEVHHIKRGMLNQSKISLIDSRKACKLAERSVDRFPAIATGSETTNWLKNYMSTCLKQWKY
ncbi:hypothetical protein HanXRQr2_Chr10g0438421 [Helianthus annuus]|nr:hypothetical protein HanXRQr2_Chr10g0438421 [Helianthus annuus]KAJ0513684.1 hypothetical protein HanHA300_Chr10g0360581 [Helianthus annuus]KAJ0529787.1 hypothetical protein HanHA89_Chr10g0382021 [Helianthus annuus]KAJ0696662.1 hypothetical protein HanLR1_Chr10g0359781 [Helianthus annuus]